MSERLEEIAYNVGISLDGEKALMSSDDYDFLYNYAKEQAELVEELEETNKKNYWIAADFKFENLKLEQQNKRYREAINKFFELDGNYKDIVNKAERIFAKALDEALESDNEND